MFDGYWHGGGMGAAMWVFLLFGLVMLVGIVLLVVFAIRAGGGLNPRNVADTSSGVGVPTPRRNSPREVLELRYARGEIETEEFRERIQALGGNVDTNP